MTRGRKTKQIFLYDPRTNVSTPTTYEYLMELLGTNENNLRSYKSKKMKLRKINCYIIDDATTVKQRKEWYEKEKYDDEIWKEIEGSEGLYKISSYGRVQKFLKNKFVFLLPVKKKSGKTLEVRVIFQGKLGTYRNHFLVAHHFLGKKPEGKVIKFKNRIQLDCVVGNLEYTDPKELGKKTGGKSRNMPVVVVNRSTGGVVAEYRSAREAAKKCHLSYQSILERCHGRTRVEYEETKFMFADDYYDVDSEVSMVELLSASTVGDLWVNRSGGVMEHRLEGFVWVDSDRFVSLIEEVMSVKWKRKERVDIDDESTI